MLRFLRRILPFLPSPPPLVTLVRLEGVIARGGGPARSISLASVEKTLERAFAASDAKAVAVVVNSPGGSPVQSRMIHDRIRGLAEEKKRPVFVFCEDVAASGGYMIALAGDEIFADAGSVMGSIGVVNSRFGLNEAISRLGIEHRIHTAGENKVRLDPFKPEKTRDVAWLEGLMSKIHDDFIDLVKSRRGSKLDQSVELFQGDIWLGREAFALGLIDGIGHMSAVLREKFGAKVRVKTIRAPRVSLPQRLLGGAADAVVDAIETRLAWTRFEL